MLVLFSMVVEYATAAATSPGSGPGEIAVLSGGIGEAEQEAILAREKEFNLKLVFSLVQGNYLADIAVVVANAGGTRVLERADTGPFLLARLPAGEYGVTATRGGRAITRQVRVADGRLRTEHLRWPADPAQDLPVSRWIERE
jgi:hypothetical protein